MNYVTGGLYRDKIYDDLYVLTAMIGEDVFFYNIRTGIKPVSYTHLTLPTIYSV